MTHNPFFSSYHHHHHPPHPNFCGVVSLLLFHDLYPEYSLTTRLRKFIFIDRVHRSEG
ncbi:hypothetical protein BDP27DRAFT_1341592 [Rhodocollybia butyracea]|uniref:Uncharacterized protein n=1 Tax=Rhodocollybia butyracea TaxID=206335 RepID=A0A9P5TYI6_9AGAR|nr:hypothetical protein BDP27DRAFT_1341592 [Rhodocollybia butyracea]